MVEPCFQGVNRLFVLAFENDTQSVKGDYLLTIQLKNYNIMINGKNFFDQSFKNDKVTYKNIRKIATSRLDEYTAGCLLNYP